MTFHEWCQRWHISDVAAAELTQVFAPRSPLVDQNQRFSTEAALQDQLRVLASNHGGSLWRNNSGAVTTSDGRHIRFGLGNQSSSLNAKWKSSDLVGVTPVTAASGERFGVFTAIEVKKPGWSYTDNEREQAQARFHTTVKMLGGLAGFAQSPDDYARIRNNG